MHARQLATTTRDDNSRVAMRSAKRVTGSATSSDMKADSVARDTPGGPAYRRFAPCCILGPVPIKTSDDPRRRGPRLAVNVFEALWPLITWMRWRLQQMMQADVRGACRARAKTNPFHGLEFNACVDDRGVDPRETGRIHMTPPASRRGFR